MPENSVSFRDGDINGMTVAGLAAALQIAIGFAVFPHSLKIDSPHSAADRLESLSVHMLSQTKNLIPEGTSDAEEATGLGLAVRLIESVVSDIRSTIG